MLSFHNWLAYSSFSPESPECPGVVPTFINSSPTNVSCPLPSTCVCVSVGAKASAFKDAGTSLKTTLQLFVGVDFSVVVEQTVAEVGRSAFLYFVAYHVVGVLIVFNLLTAIMIQLYG